jgi:ribonuclease BN (tRNA processing enzyme)
VTELAFLGTGNYSVPKGRYWSNFLIDGTVLVETSPTVLPHLRRLGVDASAIDAVVVSHFHPDHTFGWPFLLHELMKAGRDRPVYVVGPPDTQGFFAEMMALGGVSDVHEEVHAELDVQYVGIDGGWQDVGPVRLRGIEVEHVPHLRCFGYLFDRGGRIVGYSGDTRPCAGLDELARESDVLVLECNGGHPWPTHMDVGKVAELRARFPGVPFVLTHVGEEVDREAVAHIDDVVLPSDFETLTV